MSDRDNLEEYNLKKEKQYREAVEDRSISVLKTNLLVLAGVVSLSAAVFGEDTELLQNIFTNPITQLGLMLSVIATGSSGSLYALIHLSEVSTRRMVSSKMEEDDALSFDDVEQDIVEDGPPSEELKSMVALAILFTGASVPLIIVGILDTTIGLEIGEMVLFSLIGIFGVVISFTIIQVFFEKFMELYELYKSSRDQISRIRQNTDPTETAKSIFSNLLFIFAWGAAVFLAYFIPVYIFQFIFTRTVDLNSIITSSISVSLFMITIIVGGPVIMWLYKKISAAISQVLDR